MSSPNTLCAIILTQDEEVNIRRCIESLRWCDDIVVVDSGSTDLTLDISAELGARVFTHVPMGPFVISEQRNWALDSCGVTTEWVLFVDADEVVTEPLANAISKALQGPDSIDAYQLTPKYLFWGQWMKRSMGYPNWHDRLLRPSRVHLEGGVWEHFPSSAKTARLTEPYLHYGNSKGFSDWLTRHDRYSSWDAQHVVAYLDGQGKGAFNTTRKLRSRRLAARFWRFRPIARFFLMYIWRWGFLDGSAAFPFCLRYAIYEYMTVEKVVEDARQRRCLPL